MSGSHLAVPSAHKPRIYLPADGSIRARRRIASTLPGRSLKWKAMRLASLVMAPMAGTPVMKSFRAYLPVRAYLLLNHLHTCGVLQSDSLTIAVPSVVAGRDRIYLRHYTRDGEFIAFSKIGFGVDDPGFFEREVSALARLNNNGRFVVPEVLSQGHTEEIGSYLVTRSLSSIYGTLPYRGTDAVNQIKSVIGDRPEAEPTTNVTSAWWFQLALTRMSEPTRAFLEKIMAGKRDVSVAPAHGDIGGENVFCTEGGRLAIIDWENFDLKAPILTDNVSHWIGLNHKVVARRPDAALANFSAAFPDAQVDVVLALVFQIAVGLTEARALLDKLAHKGFQ